MKMRLVFTVIYLIKPPLRDFLSTVQIRPEQPDAPTKMKTPASRNYKGVRKT